MSSIPEEYSAVTTGVEREGSSHRRHLTLVGARNSYFSVFPKASRNEE